MSTVLKQETTTARAQPAPVRIPHWIAGARAEGGTRSGAVFNPATGQQTGSVAFAFKHMGVFRLAPEGLDAESLELDLIDQP